MLVDFCHWSLNPSVSCDKPSCDGYEVENLVSKNPSLHRNGFLAANFIKPPVNVTFQFPCKISIHHVLINPVVGAQKSTSIEVYTSCKRITSSWLVSEDMEGAKGRLSFNSPLFLNVGKVKLEVPTRVCFTYPKFTPSTPFTVERFQTDGCVMSELRNGRYQYLTAVSELTVRIIQTSGSCVPALKSVEIWGQPAASNGKQILQRVYKIFLDSITPKPIKQEVKHQEKLDKEDNEIASGLQIPDEFVDPITCEIMALPVLLPSGKSLDQSTLEKYISTESSWGRTPNDPFTGVAFSAESRPIPNDSLKARIDAFLLHNASNEKLKSVPRTVGKNDTKCVNQSLDNQPSVSNLVQRNIDTRKPEGKRKCDYADPDSAKVTKTKRMRTKTVPGSKFEPLSVKSQPVELGQPSSSQCKGGNSSFPNDKSLSSVSHEHQLDNSLNQAMSLLHGLPSFTRKSKTEMKSQDTCKKCVNCKSVIDESSVTYRLLCSHIICRKCVVSPGTSDQSVLCGQCKRSSLLSDITRVHVI